MHLQELGALFEGRLTAYVILWSYYFLILYSAVNFNIGQRAVMPTPYDVREDSSTHKIF